MTADHRPPPPYGPEIDLRSFNWMPLLIGRLLDSETWLLASGDEAKAMITLWCKAWHQVPAGSVPNDERLLAAYSGAGANWPNVRDMVLRGFVEHADGRLYHAVLVEEAKRSHGVKEKKAERTRAATEARLAKQRGEQAASQPGLPLGDDDQRDVKRDVSRDEERYEPRETGTGTGTGTEEKRGDIPPKAPPDFDALFEDWWRQVPKKVGKGAAQRAYKTALKRAGPEELKAGIMRYSAEVTASKTSFVKHPATWLNGQCWLDEQPTPPTNGGPGNGNRTRPSPHQTLFAAGAEVAAGYTNPDGRNRR